MYGYVYLTTNKINNKKYIGQHVADRFSESYKGSGVLIREAIKKYGKDNFETVILKECNSPSELDEYEIYFIKEYNAVDSDDFYNIMSGGAGNFYPKDVGKGGAREGASCKGTKWIHKGKDSKRVQPDEVQYYLSIGWELGATKRSDLAKQRYRDSKAGLIVVTDGNVVKYCKEEELQEFFSNGFRVGRIPTMSGEQAKRLVHMHNDTESIRVDVDDVDSYLRDGYVIGRKKFKTFNRKAPPHNKGKHLVDGHYE